MPPTPLPSAGTGAVFPEQYEEQLQDKVARVRELFASNSIALPEVEVHRSSPRHFRMRTEFRLWHEGADLIYVMWEPQEAADATSAAAPAAAADGHGEASATAAAGTSAAQASEHAGPAALAASSSEAVGAEGSGAAAAPAAQGNGGGARRGSGRARKKQKQAGAKPPGAHKSAQRVRIDTFPVASELICSLMPLLRRELLSSPVLRDKLFGAAFHTTLSKQAMITLTYHRQLDDVWREAAAGLRARLAKELGPEACEVLHVVGRSRKQKVALDADHVTERMDVAGRTYQYQQVEGCFSQPNGGVCQQMLRWAVNVTAGSKGDLLELYCGNANFTLPLAANFKQVVATEVSKALVAAARFNMELNAVSNVTLARMSSEEFVETWRVKGTRQRLAGLDWDSLSLDTLLVDPPRAGLDSATEALLRDFDQILYISCNPQTLVANLASVAATHEVARFAVFDQFPYTHHLECGAFLRRKEAAA